MQHWPKKYGEEKALENKTAYHTPALLAESIEALNIRPDGIYIDATFGGGGHSRAILAKLKKGKLIAFDRDIDAQSNIVEDKKLLLIQQDFIHLKNFLSYLKYIPVDGILADLGISSHQVDEPTRGFSFRYDAPLDMRMDIQQKKTARDIVNEYRAGELQSIFSKYGEIKNARTLANAIVEARKTRAIETTGQLAAIAENVAPKNIAKKYLAMVFQSIRIEVNNEMEGLRSFLSQSLDVLKSGGRLAVITYHSLEDRPVKNFMLTGNFDGDVQKDVFGQPETPWKAVVKKPIIADDAEVAANPRVRSAKLRVAEKL